MPDTQQSARPNGSEPSYEELKRRLAAAEAKQSKGSTRDSIDVRIDEKNHTITIVLPMLPEPTASSSGKTLVVATTHGNVAVPINVQGRVLRVGVNAYIASK